MRAPEISPQQTDGKDQLDALNLGDIYNTSFCADALSHLTDIVVEDPESRSIKIIYKP